MIETKPNSWSVQGENSEGRLLVVGGRGRIYFTTSGYFHLTSTEEVNELGRALRRLVIANSRDGEICADPVGMGEELLEGADDGDGQ
jgi:hypothetical protein